MLKKYLLGLLGLGALIAWLSIDEGFGYLGSIFLVILFALFFLWRIPKEARVKKVPYRIGRILLNLACGLVLFFITLEREVNNLNFAYNSTFTSGVITNVAIDRCQKGLKKKSGFTDCWQVEVSSGIDTYGKTSFSKDQYKEGDIVQILVAGPVQNDMLSYDWVPFFGDAYTRISYEIHDEQFDQRQRYLNELQSNFGFVMGAFSIALILFGLRWITVLGVTYEPPTTTQRTSQVMSKRAPQLSHRGGSIRKEPSFSRRFTDDQKDDER